MRSSNVYYGWYVVAAAFAVMFLGFACAYSYSAFFPDLQREFDASRATISSVFSVGGAMYFILGAISGPISDRYGPRWVSAFGMAVLGLGFVFAGTAEGLTAVYLGFGLGIGIGLGFSYVPSVGAVQPWFVEKRGFASGLAVSGIGVGTLLGPLIASGLISIADWRSAFIVMGAVTLVLGVAAALILENDPSKRGGNARGASATQSQDSLTLSEAIRTRPFILMYLSAAALSFALFVPFVHLVPYALDNGLSATTGALLIGLIGVGSTVGRFAVGGVADRFGRQTVYSTCFVGVAVIFFVWLVSSGLVTLAIFAFAFGTFYGGFVALAPAVTVDYFGTRSAGATIGVIYSSVAIGTAFGPPFAGYVYDEFGSYRVAIFVGELAAIAGALLSMALPLPERWRAARNVSHLNNKP